MRALFPRFRCVVFLALVAFFNAGRAQEAPKPPDSSDSRYIIGKASRDGIGKFYMGREIAHVVGGHETARWLERPERAQEERPDLLMQALQSKLKPGDTVADIGAGSGYYTRRLARAVGEKGTVYAVEIQQDMLDLIATNMARHGVTNVKGVLGTIRDPKLPPESVDLVLMVDVYHEFSHPYEMLQGICRALKPGGVVVFVEFRAEDPEVPIKPAHKMSEAQVKKEMSVQPLEWVETISTLPWQHVILFKKRRQAERHGL